MVKQYVMYIHANNFHTAQFRISHYGTAATILVILDCPTSILNMTCMYDHNSQCHNMHVYKCLLRTIVCVYICTFSLYESPHRKSYIYKSKRCEVFIRSVVEKMESMESQQVASTFMDFLQR